MQQMEQSAAAAMQLAKGEKQQREEAERKLEEMSEIITLLAQNHAQARRFVERQP